MEEFFVFATQDENSESFGYRLAVIRADEVCDFFAETHGKTLKGVGRQFSKGAHFLRHGETYAYLWDTKKLTIKELSSITKNMALDITDGLLKGDLTLVKKSSGDVIMPPFDEAAHENAVFKKGEGESEERADLFLFEKDGDSYVGSTLQQVPHKGTGKQEPKQQQEEPQKSKKMESETTLNLGCDLNQFIGEAVKDYTKKKAEEFSREVISKKIEEVAQELRPVNVTIGGRQTVETKGRKHKKFEEALFLCEQERQAYIQGPAGSGKTTLAKQVAESFNLPFGSMSVTAGMSEAHLTGRMLFDGTYVESDFVNKYESGGVFLFDEIDAADPNTLLIINSAIANGHMTVPNRKEKPTAERHQDFIVIVAGNTWGKGSSEYTGREMQDEAFLDRFALSKVEVDYDDELERHICDPHTEVYEEIRKIRKKVKENRLKRTISTRAFVSATRQYMAGSDLETIKERLTLDWSESEKSNV